MEHLRVTDSVCLLNPVQRPELLRILLALLHLLRVLERLLHDLHLLHRVQIVREVARQERLGQGLLTELHLDEKAVRRLIWHKNHVVFFDQFGVDSVEILHRLLHRVLIVAALFLVLAHLVVVDQVQVRIWTLLAVLGIRRQLAHLHGRQDLHFRNG